MEKTQTQKTPEQWFQMLKEPYRSEAIANIVDNRPVLSLNSALECQKAWDLTPQRFEYWNKIAVSIKACETTYLEPEILKPEPIELRPEEPTDWKAMYHDLKAKYDQLEKGEKVYFYTDHSGNLRSANDIEIAKAKSGEDYKIYEAVCIGKKKSVLVNETT